MAKALFSAITSLINELREDYIASREDEYVKIRREVFKNYYLVKRIQNLQPATIGFVDAGFKKYKLDVSIIMPIHLGGVVKDIEGNILTLNNLLKEPPTDMLLLYASRRRHEGGYEFKFRLKILQKRSFLLEDEVGAEEANKRLKEILEASGLTVSKKTPKIFTKLTQYIEGLVELAYAIKLLMKLEEKGYSINYTVIDGTLVKWFSIRRAERPQTQKIDGLDIVAAILGEKIGTIKSYLRRVIGLSKTTSFTRLIRSHEIFYYKLVDPSASRDNLYSLIDIDGVKRVGKLLTDFLSKHPVKDFVLETIHILNRPVYFYHGIHVSRFPLTMDGMNVFTIDIYLEKPIIDLRGDKVVVSEDQWINSVNSYIMYIVHSLFSQRARIYAEPPRGFMEVDNLVRFRPELQALFEQALLAALGQADDLTARILKQAFTSTIHMRYEYR